MSPLTSNQHLKSEGLETFDVFNFHISKVKVLILFRCGISTPQKCKSVNQNMLSKHPEP